MKGLRRLGAFVGAVAGCALLATPARADCPPNDVWPGDDWSVDLVDGPQKAALDDYAFTLTGSDDERLGIRTDGMVVIHRGQIIYENYGRGFEKHHPHLTWSVSKSFLNALVGVGVGRGLLTLEDSACDYYDDVDDCEITVGDLLNMGSGLEWNEGYEDDPYHLSSVIAMLYGVGALDMARFTGEHPTESKPGTVYRYSSGDSNLLAAVLAGSMEESQRDDFPWTWLFDKIGMDTTVFEQDAAGTFVASSYVYATPREMARFGYLYQNDGCWDGTRILPEGWVERSVSVNPVFLNEYSFEWDRDGDQVPGSHFWVNRSIPSMAHDKRWSDVPEDAFQASGHWGQTITVIPSEELVVVRTADDREPGTPDKNRFLKLAIELGRAHG